MKTVLVLVLSGALALTACGGGGEVGTATGAGARGVETGDNAGEQPVAGIAAPSPDDPLGTEPESASEDATAALEAQSDVPESAAETSIAAAGPSPILFVTQVAIRGSDFAQITGTFANHLPAKAPRGGDLMIAYPPAIVGGRWQLRNLTREAGFGMQGGVPTTKSCATSASSNLVAVREPAVSWDGAEALVSMLVGCSQGARWQIYRIRGLGKGQAVLFERLPQPSAYNNLSPVYSSHAKPQVIFSSDMPRGGPHPSFKHLKCLDEYEEHPAVCGLWRLNPVTGKVRLLHPSPSGAFTPTVDSFGRVIFTQWDHLDSDQQEYSEKAGQLLNYMSESANAASERFTSPNRQIQSVFPEHRFNPVAGFSEHVMKVFLPWQINQDGTGAETTNHFGRHEFNRFAPRARTKSSLMLEDLLGARGANEYLSNMGLRPEAFRFIRESQTEPGLYYGVLTPEFGTHGSGAIATLNAGPLAKPRDMRISLVTSPDTYGSDGPALYRSPLPGADGVLWASVSTVTGASISGAGSPLYNFRISRLAQQGHYHVPAPGGYLTQGLTRVLDGSMKTLWEWDPVEVRPRKKPTVKKMDPVLAASPEGQMFAAEAAAAGLSFEDFLAEFRSFLAKNKLALIVSRNLTWRDSADMQQPFNLAVRGGAVETRSVTRPNADVLNVDHLQLFTAEQLRGVEFVSDASPQNEFRRVLPQPMKPITVSGKNVNLPAQPGSPPGSIRISPVDGSMAAIVPAERAMSWQLIDSHKPGVPSDRTDGIVRERMWIGFQPGEIRVCVACHGGSPEDTAQNGKKFKQLVNAPDALLDLLKHYRNNLR